MFPKQRFTLTDVTNALSSWTSLKPFLKTKSHFSGW